MDTAGRDHYFHTSCPSVRSPFWKGPFQNLTKQNKSSVNSDRYCGTVDLTEGIINDACLVMFHFFRIGRVKTLMLATVGILIFGIGAAFSNSIQTFVALRFFTAFFTISLFTVGYCYSKSKNSSLKLAYFSVSLWLYYTFPKNIYLSQNYFQQIC